MSRPLAIQQRTRIEAAWLCPTATIVVICFLCAQMIGLYHGIDSFDLLGDYTDKAIGVGVMLIPTLPTMLLLKAWRAGAGSPARFILDLVKTRIPGLVALAGTAAPFLLMPLLFTAYGVLKMLMPVTRPFAWDGTFAALDRLLFLGKQPWVISHALLAHPLATMLLDRLYSLWVVLLSVAIVGFALFASAETRARFFLSFTLTWLLLGLGGGYLLSSAGPCFAPLVGADGAGEFAALRTSLGQIASEGGFRINALHWQDTLWRAHVGRDYAFAMGISAMPSMHNAVAVLYALALGRARFVVRALAWGFAALVFVGSVHLGWHYAVDGIVSAVAVVLIWALVGRYLRAASRAQSSQARGSPRGAVRAVMAQTIASARSGLAVGPS